MLLNAETGRARGEDPSSERWLQYYKEARRRRRALGPREHTRFKIRRMRQQQLAKMTSGFMVVAVLSAVFYFVLGR